MQNMEEQIAEVETHIAERNKAIARMERDLEASKESLADKWFRTCTFNLKKSRLERETLEHKLQKLLSGKRHLDQLKLAAKLKEDKRLDGHARELAKMARAKERTDLRQINAVELCNRKCVELRRLVAPFVGEEQSYAMVYQAEKLAQEWMDKRLQATPASNS